MLRFTTAAIAVAIFGQGAHASTLVTFDLPGQTAICGGAISDDGAVVGNTAGLTKPVVNFLYQGGSFTTLMPAVPAGMVAVTGINRAHTITGLDLVVGANFSFSDTGFTLANRVTSVVTIPGATSVSVTGLTNAGVLIGSYQASANGPTVGFIKRGKRASVLNDGSGGVVPGGTDPTASHVVGTSVAGSNITGWLYSLASASFTQIAVPGALATFPHGINRAGTISGTYFTGAATAPVSHGFTYAGGVFTPYDVPGASSTELTGINVYGAVTGCYTDTAGTHGLVLEPGKAKK